MARIVVILGLLLTGCAEKSGQTTVTGMISVPGGDVFYEISNPEASGIPLLLIHGGPGGTSCSFGLLDDQIRPARNGTIGSARAEVTMGDFALRRRN